MNKPKQNFSKFATGIIKMHPRGFGFLQPEEKEFFSEDIFIPRAFTKGAVDGDFVEASIATSPKGYEGKITKILKRGRGSLVGSIVFISKKGAFAYAPLLGEERLMKIIPSEKKELKPGDRIVIKVLDWGTERRESLGEVASYIGHISDPASDIQAAVEEFELEKEFPAQVLKNAQKVGTKVKTSDLKGRLDLREMVAFTIDPDTAKDYDDALSLTQDEKGNFHLAVHIADVSHYVKKGSPLDLTAKERCNSVYFPGFVIPMLPHELSSHLCSLKPDVSRLAITVFMEFDPEGELLNYRIARSVIQSKKRFTYKQAKEVLDGKKESPFSKELFLMVDLCHRLKRKRTERGSIEFALPDTSIHVTPEGIPTKIEIVEYDITHQFVEEFMLKANEVVATHLSKEGKPLTFRIHDQPNPENMRDFANLAESLGFKISKNPSTEDLQNLFDEARESPFGQFLTTQFIRNMKLAHYSTQNIGHYGLGLEAYTHFTSPIRRYIDLIVHRLLFDEVGPEENLDQIALTCSEKERVASRAENSVVNIKKLRLLQEVLKKEPHTIFKAVITSVKPFGFAFEIVDFLYEGFLPLSQITPHERLFFNESKRKLESRNRSFKTGDRIEVILKEIDLITQQTNWLLFTREEAPKKKFPKKKKRYRK